MAKQIVVLEQVQTRGYRVVFWATPPSTRVLYWKQRAPAKSAWPGASAAENTEITEGRTVESVETLIAPGPVTMAEFQQIALDRWAAFNTTVQNENPWQRYGSYYDPVAVPPWTVVNVP